MEVDRISNLIKNNLFIRIITAMVMLPPLLFFIYIGGILFTGFIVVVSVLMAFEWYKMISQQKDKYFTLWQVIGLIYITLPCASMIWLREQDKGREIIFWLISVVFATDIMAYFVGKTFGGWKIAPKISPNKTWSGLLGGVCAAAIVGIITSRIYHSNNPKYLIGLSIILAIYAQTGDFFESWIKRKFNIKDTGNIIPGHGGIMDRVDGIVPVAPKVAMIVLFDHWGIF
ncbi:MAG: CDP-archaeol synthase [Rickettsiales bacterium]|nr:MAG: CDP-archaeol synthase [Rickettsiales bacterium]